MEALTLTAGEGEKQGRGGWRRKAGEGEKQGRGGTVGYRESGRVWWCELRVETSLWDGQASRGGENK